MMKQNSNFTTMATVCGDCGGGERHFLHHVRLEGNFRLLCTTCVLRLHPHRFCPACLAVFDRSPPDDSIICYKCYSYSHPTCVSSPPVGARSPSPSPCSSCLNPNSLIFDLKTVDCANSNRRKAIDKSAANLMLAAAKIAALSMSRAAAAAAMEAERRAKEAAYTRKRAREALDHVVYLMEKEKKCIASNKIAFGNANSTVVSVPVVDYRRGNKADISNKGFEALNTMEIKEKGRQMQGLSVESAVSEAQSKRSVAMDVKANDDKDLGLSSTTKNGTGKNDHPGKTVQGENISNGVVPSVTKEQNLEKNRAMEDVDLRP